MLKVKAIWTVGYPSGPDKKIYSDGDLFVCDEEWGRRKAEQGKVEIVEKSEEEEPEDKKITGEETLEEKLAEFNEGYGWYKLPDHEKRVRKEEAIEILKGG